MPYGMTNVCWNQRYANIPTNPVVQATDCPRASCNAIKGGHCWTRLGNHAVEIHLVRVRAYMDKWTTHHTPDGQPL